MIAKMIMMIFYDVIGDGSDYIDDGDDYDEEIQTIESLWIIEGQCCRNNDTSDNNNDNN
jgi:hypothetical protein